MEVFASMENVDADQVSAVPIVIQRVSYATLIFSHRSSAFKNTLVLPDIRNYACYYWRHHILYSKSPRSDEEPSRP